MWATARAAWALQGGTNPDDDEEEGVNRSLMTHLSIFISLDNFFSLAPIIIFVLPFFVKLGLFFYLSSNLFSYVFEKVFVSLDFDENFKALW